MKTDTGQRTEEQDWVERRVRAVESHYTAFMALQEIGVDMIEEHTSQQVFCPFHDNKNTPAARYYSSSGRKPAHFWCFKCKDRLGGIGVYAKSKNIKFMDALSALEKRFKVKVPRRPESSPIAHIEKDSGYESQAWADVPRFLGILEKKLSRIRDKSGISEYVRLCRLIDAIEWDFNLIGKANADMIKAMMKASSMMDVIANLEDPLA